MSKWITNRQPTEKDADEFGQLWVTDSNGQVASWNWRSIGVTMPWQPIHKPSPCVKPKRWVLRWSDDFDQWIIKDIDNGDWLSLAFLSEYNHDAAKRILDIFNEVMP